ncbi:DUF2637 domain-containing protein [Amycolatopsis sp. NPDC003865]
MKRAALRTRFERALSGRLVMLLVAMAAATAWYGQYRYLRETQALGVVFSAAGATALELFGLSMFANARQLGKFRDRAVRVRGFGWMVIVFSAYSNWVHNGLVLAAMSVAGPVAWELHEWTQQRVRLHNLGKLTPRPVRPRFPIDQVLLFPLWSMRAYRCAVRDRIESAAEALAVARKDRLEPVGVQRIGSRSWRRTVRRSIARHRTSSTGAAGVKSVLIDRLIGRSDLMSVDTSRLIRYDNPTHGAGTEPRFRGGESMPIAEPGRSTWSWLRRGKEVTIGSTETRLRGSRPHHDRSIERPSASSIDEQCETEAPCRQPSPDLGEQVGSIKPARKATVSGGGDDSRSSTGEPSRSTDRRPVPAVARSVNQLGKRRALSIPELLPLARQVASAKGWTTVEQVKAEPLRIALRISPKRSRTLRSELRKEIENKGSVSWTT